MTARSIEDRVAGAAEAALADRKFVTLVDVLMGRRMAAARPR
jgi:hypothetical protein